MLFSIRTVLPLFCGLEMVINHTPETDYLISSESKKKRDVEQFQSHQKFDKI